LSFGQWVDYFNFNGNQYPFLVGNGITSNVQEEVARTFAGFATQLFHGNGPVFTCIVARMLLFSEARFQFRQRRSGKPGDLFGTEELVPLEKPWLNGTTGDLLARAMLDSDLAGNFYARKVPGGLMRLRPDWVTIVLTPTRFGEPELQGYLFHPGGHGSSEPPVALLPEDVVHFAPIADPVARYRGVSWLGPVISEIMGDNAATTHKLKFFENGATLGTVAVLNEKVAPEQFQQWVELFRASHGGLDNAYTPLVLAGGADVKVVGADLKQLDFKATQGAGETRICAAARIPPIVAGFSEGLDAATYSNYGQARRHFADGTLRPLWRNIAASLESIITVPDGAELWYDDRDIPFLQEDLKDRAEVLESKARQIKLYTDAGFDPDTAVDAVTSEDLSRLKASHSGLFSVQLQPPGSKQSNGKGSGQLALPLPKPA
jgi:hypothetical protein